MHLVLRAVVSKLIALLTILNLHEVLLMGCLYENGVCVIKRFTILIASVELI